MGFNQWYTDTSLYIETDANGKINVGIYVDDVLVKETSVKKTDDFLNDMQVVKLKGLGVVL